MMPYSLSAAAAGLCFLVAAQAQAADVPAALALDVAGKGGGISAYSEVMDGQKLHLAPGDSVTLLHYRTCRTISVKGGDVSVGVGKIDVSGGSVTDTPGENCPQEVRVATAGVGGGVLMRSVAFPTVPARLDCLVVGSRAPQVSAVVLREGEAKRLTLPVVNHRITQPQDVADLSRDADYTLDLTDKGGATVDSIGVGVIDAVPGKVCLLRVD